MGYHVGEAAWQGRDRLGKRTEAVGTAEPRGSIRSPQKKMNRRPKIGGVLSLERLGIPHAI